MAARSRTIAATAQVSDLRSGVLLGARLVAGVDAATAVIREKDAAGNIVAKLSAPSANAVDEFLIPTGFAEGLHVTLTGTTPQFNLYL